MGPGREWGGAPLAHGVVHMSNDDDAIELTRTIPHSAELESPDFRYDHLQIRRIHGREAISQLFRFDVLVVCTDASAPILDPDTLIGSSVRLHLFSDQGVLIRTVYGIVSEARVRADSEAIVHAAYELSVVPRAFRLGLVKTQEVFLNMSIPDIIMAKLTRHGLHHSTTLRVTESYPSREYVVQYAETDLAFISRLAEHAGLSFHFEHGLDDEEKLERLVFTDHIAGFQTFGTEPIAFSPRGDRLGVFELATTSRLIPTTYVVQDYDDEQPDLDIGAVERLEEGNGGGVVEFGANLVQSGEGAALAKVRALEQLAARRVTSGSSVVGGFTAGALFKLDDHPLDEKFSLVLLTAVEHHFEQVVGQGIENGNRYHNTFTATGSDTPFRPARVTPKPRIHGLMTGVVLVGADGVMGGDAKLDIEGRYQVQVHFDTFDYAGRNCSLPVRMAQPFAGPAQGMHYPLRPGTEVAIGFVGGDPDRPVIVGALPNAQTRSVVTSIDPHMHRVRSRHGLVVEFGKTLSDED